MEEGREEFKKIAKGKGCILQWQDSNGEEHESPEEVWLDMLFGFCGCSDKEGMYSLVTKYMNKLSHGGGHEPEYYTSFIEELFRGDEVYFYFVANLVDTLGLAEHGTAIRGAWLTPAGEYALKLLTKQGFLETVDDYYN